MIVEIAKITLKTGSGDAFERAVANAAELFRRVPGCLGMQLLRPLEVRDSYRLVIEWRTLEDHVVHFRASAEFTEWRAIISPFLDGPLHIENTEPFGVGF
jgi:heme-degrading monooxygenase HmoA